jgi:type II secretory pathway component PulK
VTRARPSRRRASPTGFALPSVLFVVAMVTLVFLVAVEALTSLADQTRKTADRVRFEATALSLEAQTVFLAATRPMAPAALLRDRSQHAQPLLVLDGRAYSAAPGGLTVAVQDEGGLINLDNLTQPAMAALFAALNAPMASRGAMVDRLSDYLDADDVKRPEGAEADDYQRAGLPPPPNGPMRRRSEVLGVMGWRGSVAAAAWRSFSDNVTADPRSSSVNVNTATLPALTVLFGLSQAQARAAIAQRQVAPFATLEDMGRAASVALVGDSERIYSFPNGRFALKIEDPRSGLAYRSRILLSPEDSTRPFWIAEPAASALSAAEKASTPSHAPLFPDPAA